MTVSDMDGAPFDEARGEDDRIREDADTGHVDLHDVSFLEREVVRGDEAGAREQDASRRHGVVTNEILDELLERALHPQRGGLSLEEHLAGCAEYLHADLERLVGRWRDDRRSE